ncbi:uncharacterized protein A1O9_07715 [Exophiala aquamarina CBS 119918]|uniref:Transcription factor domain-containing protein n=1 Tax=Exophiala aquamarina CBS 119918 TaxID=1182545 RepID=A0A072P7M5_9EURO|nr:uncharacterized protein A1O9_07715 [Exophiala aquamarina CBS 119918]KEF56134.1 hypothetical protein A1O9_07715 [Exophiala aquamarina CBS 119918]
MATSPKLLADKGYGNRLRWKSMTAREQGPNSDSKHGLIFKNQHCSDESIARAETEPPALETSVSGQPIHSLEGLPTSVSKQLLEFYCSNIAPMMVWLDSKQNEYKRLVIPLAETQQVLRLAIMAIAAARAPHNFDVDDSFSRQAYEAALRLITERIREMTDVEFRDQPVDTGPNASTNEATLAAMLILSNHSLLGSDITQA